MLLSSYDVFKIYQRRSVKKHKMSSPISSCKTWSRNFLQKTSTRETKWIRQLNTWRTKFQSFFKWNGLSTVWLSRTDGVTTTGWYRPHSSKCEGRTYLMFSDRDYYNCDVMEPCIFSDAIKMTSIYYLFDRAISDIHESITPTIKIGSHQRGILCHNIADRFRCLLEDQQALFYG